MRNYIVIFVVLVFVCAAALGCVHAAVNAAKDQVVLTETTLSGDKSVSDGLRIRTINEYNDRLIWDTTHTTGENPVTETDFQFFSSRNPVHYDFEYHGVRLECYIHGGLDTKSPMEELTPIEQAYRKLYDSLEPGHEAETILRVADYYTYYPVMIDIQIPGFGLFSYEDMNTYEEGTSEAMLVDHYRNFFRIPVLENEYMEVSVQKGPTNSIGGLGVGSANHGDRYFMSSHSVLTDDACYFIIDAHTDHGNLVDTSEISGGFGIYRQPYNANSADRDHFVDPTALSMVFALDPNMRVCHFAYNEPYHQLLLATEEYGQMILRIIDTETHALLQEFAIDDPKEQDTVWNLIYQENYIVLTLSGNRIAVLDADSGGRYTMRFVITLDALSDAANLIFQIDAVDWNGEKLAIASNMREWVNSCAFRLGIFDQTGVRYCGAYTSSLTTGYEVKNDQNYYVQARGIDMLALDWIA